VKSFIAWHTSETNIEEALSIAQRRKRAIIMKRLKPKIRRGRELAKRRMAPPKKLRTRARKQARALMFKKYASGMSASDMSVGQRRQIEDRLKTKSSVIARIAKKLYPHIKKAEVHRLKSAAKGEINKNSLDNIKKKTPGQG
jgi:hypothetical protein